MRSDSKQFVYRVRWLLDGSNHAMSSRDRKPSRPKKRPNQSESCYMAFVVLRLGGRGPNALMLAGPPGNRKRPASPKP